MTGRRIALVVCALLVGTACSPPQDAVDVRIGPKDDSVSWEDARPQFVEECLAEGLEREPCQCLFRLVRDTFDSVEDYAESTQAPHGFDAAARVCIDG